MKKLFLILATLISIAASAQYKNVQIPQNDYPANGSILQRVNNQWRSRTLQQLATGLDTLLSGGSGTNDATPTDGSANGVQSNGVYDALQLKQNADADLTTYASITPTTVAQALLAFANPSAIRFLRVNADNTVSGRTAAELLSDISGVSTTRTLTINGTAYDLSANRSWTVASAFADLTGNPTDNSALSTALAAKQPLDADLTTYAGITPTTIGQGLLSFASPSAVRFFKINADNTISGRTAAEMLSDIGAASAGHDHSGIYQTADADLTIYAGITPFTVAQNILGLSDPSATRYIKINDDNTVSLRTASEMLGDIGAQASDADLTTIAGLTATTDNFIVSVSSAWASRTPSQVKTTLSLNNVDNTSDANKPVSTAQAAAIALKGNLSGGNTWSGNQTYSGQLFATAITRDATLTDSAMVADATTGEFIMRKIDITVTAADIGLGNVDNYSAAQLATLTQTLTGKTIDGDDNTLQDIPASAIKTSETETLDISLYATKASPTFTGTVVLPSTTSIGNVSSTEVGYVDGVTSAIQTQLDNKIGRQIKSLNALGFSTKLETLGIEWGAINTGTALTDGRLHMIYMGVPDKDETVTTVTFYQSTQGSYTADNENRIGLYSYNAATGDFTLVASTANDGNIWKAATGFVNTAFTASANLTAGTPYFIGALYNSSAQTTAPSIMGGATNGTSILAIGTAGVRLSSGLNTATLSSSTTAASLASVSSRPWFKLY